MTVLPRPSVHWAGQQRRAVAHTRPPRAGSLFLGRAGGAAFLAECVDAAWSSSMGLFQGDTSVTVNGRHGYIEAREDGPCGRGLAMAIMVAVGGDLRVTEGKEGSWESQKKLENAGRQEHRGRYRRSELELGSFKKQIWGGKGLGETLWQSSSIWWQQGPRQFSIRRILDSQDSN